MATGAKQYFESVRRAKIKADEAELTAELMNEHLGDARGMRYDNVGGGHGKNSYVNNDSMVQSIVRLENAQKRMYEARDNALAMVAEAFEVVSRMMEDDNADVAAIRVLIDYYIKGMTEEEIGKRRYMSQPKVNRLKQRGLSKSEPFLRRYSLI